jgi:protein-S-isoprenylcysteine O-methyltransferase Ste14
MDESFFRVGLPLVGGFLVVLAAFFRAPGPHDGLRWIGLLLALLGLTGVILARWTLGRSFSVTPQARTLVTSGIYSKIRNPIYIFSCIMLAGITLMIRFNYLWIALAVLVIVQTMRARRESHVLEEAFGDEYRKYRDSTWF